MYNIFQIVIVFKNDILSPGTGNRNGVLSIDSHEATKTESFTKMKYKRPIGFLRAALRLRVFVANIFCP